VSLKWTNGQPSQPGHYLVLYGIKNWPFVMFFNGKQWTGQPVRAYLGPLETVIPADVLRERPSINTKETATE
jgi:hypothetical protein